MLLTRVPAGLRVLVVNDGSTDGAAEVARSFEVRVVGSARAAHDLVKALP